MRLKGQPWRKPPGLRIRVVVPQAGHDGRRPPPTLDRSRSSGRRDLIDLGREDEVVLGQAADGVGEDLDPHVAVALDMQIGMVLFPLGEGGDVVDQFHGLAEVFQADVAADPRAVVGEPPGGELPDLRLGLGGGVAGHASFAGDALLAG